MNLINNLIEKENLQLQNELFFLYYEILKEKDLNKLFKKTKQIYDSFDRKV